MEPNPSPLTAEQALAQLSAGRKRQHQIELARARGLRSILFGMLGLAIAGVLNVIVPAELWLAVPALAAMSGLLVALGLLRLLAAQALARRA